MEILNKVLYNFYNKIMFDVLFNIFSIYELINMTIFAAHYNLRFSA